MLLSLSLLSRQDAIDRAPLRYAGRGGMVSRLADKAAHDVQVMMIRTVLPVWRFYSVV